MSDYESRVIRKKIRVHGAVQGVGFRYRTEHAANALGVTGWVRNNPDGTVSLEMQGTESQIDQVLAAVQRGTWVCIEKMEASSLPVEEHEHDFVVRGGRG